MRNPWMLFGAYYVFNAIVSGMPAPGEKDGKGYRWAYTSLHVLAGNAKTVFLAMRNGASKEEGK